MAKILDNLHIFKKFRKSSHQYKNYVKYVKYSNRYKYFMKLSHTVSKLGQMWPKFWTTCIFLEILGNQVISMNIMSNMSNYLIHINILGN